MGDKDADLVKLMMVGNTYVGKTAMLTRMCDDDFNEAYIVTIGVDFKQKIVECNCRKLRVQVWDTAGQERFGTINCAYYRGAMGMVICYSVTDKESFQAVEKWVNVLKEHGSPNVQRVLVGNKSDLEGERKVSAEEGQALADQLGIKFFECSAKLGLNVAEAFMHLVDGVAQTKWPAKANDNIILDTKAGKKKKSFC